MPSFSKDILLNIFSFFKTPHEITRLNIVCKQWKEVANQDTLWMQFIKDNYKVKNQHGAERLKNTGITAKELYKNNISVRKDIFFLVADDPIDTNLYLREDNQQILIDLFNNFNIYNNSNIKIFDCYETAENYADFLSQVNTKFRTKVEYMDYIPIFIVRLDLTKNISFVQSELTIKKQIWVPGTDKFYHYHCIEIPYAKINYVYSVRYKTGKFFPEDLASTHEIKLNYPIKTQLESEEEITKARTRCCGIQ